MWPTSPSPHVVIVGGGIAGLAAAHALATDERGRAAGIACTLVEAEDRVGGKLRTEVVDGCLVECGPDSFLATKPWARDLCVALGLQDRLVGTRPGRGVYVAYRGRLRPLPDGLALGVPTRPSALVRVGLLSPGEALRAAADLVLPRRAATDDEPVGRLLRRRLGGLLRLMGLIMSRATLLHCMLALLPFLYRARGAPATEGAAAISVMLFSGALGGMVGGYLSDRYGRRQVLFVSFAIATPLFLAAIASSGSATMVFLALGGGALLGSSSLVTVEAQSLLPTHTSLAAGMMLGVSMGIGGLVVGPVSALAQAFGITPVLIGVSLLPLPGSLLTLSLARPASTPRSH
ncbi:MAG: FAD-dependent oxidoreductase [Firmicutes bacterium]|nr:FAD-dependent oxidoreductase [Bacillota bacterium]